MQTNKQQLMAQQLVLFHLGFYKGAIDGIWSDETILAKKMYEFDRSFGPGLPNGGLPFGNHERLPRGLSRDAENNIVCNTLTKEKAAEIMEASARRLGISTDKPKDEQPAKDEPIVEVAAPEVEVAADVVETEESPKEERKQEHQRPDFHRKDKDRHQKRGK
jgi:hypothetical protein